MSLSDSPSYRLTLALVVIVHLSGLFTDVTMGDSALYAIISKEMALSNNYLELFRNGVDWLDKPHFQFWVSAVSFEVLGISSFAFKLPALLFTAVSAVYTYLLARRLYDEDVAALAVMILLTAQHLFLSSADVRAEPYLTGLIVGSTYHFYLVDRNEYIARNLLLGSLLAAAALMTKGLITVIPMVAAIGGAAILDRRGHELLKPRWLAAVGLTLVFTTPEFYALYYQFDLHPEKVVFGTTGVSGIRWFLWDSQFGRFMNTGPIRGKGDPFFFVHTLLWAFLPWGILLYAAIGKTVLAIVKNGARKQESYTFAAAITTLLIFSASRFQLPHYANIVFPFLAILTAWWIHGFRTRGEGQFYRITQYLTITLGVIAIVVLQVVSRPDWTSVPFLVLALTTVLAFVRVSRHVTQARMVVFYRTCLMAVLVNGYFQMVTYPALLEYQSGSHVAALANADYPGRDIVGIGVHSHPLIFHARAAAPEIDLESFVNSVTDRDEPVLVYTTEGYAREMGAQGLEVEIIEAFDHYHITRLSARFLDRRRRGGEIESRVLAMVTGRPAW